MPEGTDPRAPTGIVESPTPTPPLPAGRREYFVAKEVKAGDVGPDQLVWLELPPETAAEPEIATELAAKREDENGVHKEGTKYMASSRPKIKVPAKTIKTEWS